MNAQRKESYKEIRAKPTTEMMRQKYNSRRRSKVTDGIKFDKLLRYFFKGMTYEDIANETGASTSTIGKIYRRFYEPIFGMSREALRTIKHKEKLEHVLKQAEKSFFTLPHVAPVIAKLRGMGFAVEAVPYNVVKANEPGVLKHVILVNGKQCALLYTGTERTQSAVLRRVGGGATAEATFIRFNVNPKSVRTTECVIAYALLPRKRMKMYIIPSEKLESISDWQNRGDFEFAVPLKKTNVKVGRKPILPWSDYEDAVHHLK